MDNLVLENYLLHKAEQPAKSSRENEPVPGRLIPKKSSIMDKSKFKERREWRKFGIGVSIILTILGTIQWIMGKSMFPMVYLTAGIVLASALLFPLILKPMFILFSYIGFGLGWVMTRVILSTLFFLVLTPIGLFSRLLGKRYLQTNLDRNETTYWKNHQEQTASKKHFEKQF